jgi:uncharacterized protein (UPF0212 family)
MRADSPIVECPSCGTRFEDWWRPCADSDCDPELADPGFLESAGTSTCPHCGEEIHLGVLGKR